VIPICPELRSVLDETPRAERHGSVVVPWMNVNRDLGRACERAGIEPRVTCHDLRRTFGSWLAQAGVSTKAIGTLLGHAPGSRMADLTYSVLTDETLTEAVGRLTVPNVCHAGPQNDPQNGTAKNPANENGAQVIDLKRRSR